MITRIFARDFAKSARNLLYSVASGRNSVLTMLKIYDILTYIKCKDGSK